MIRYAEAKDYESLVRGAKAFTQESGLPLTWSERHARETIWAQIHDPSVDFIVEVERADFEDVITGGAIIVYDQDYYEETCAIVQKFFVYREFRGRGTSDNLLKGVLGTCVKRGALLVFAQAGAAMGWRMEKLFVRLFQRHGFEILGRAIMRTL